MCVKILKCVAVLSVLLMVYFAIAHPCGCVRFQCTPIDQSKYKALRIVCDLNRLKASGQDLWPCAADGDGGHSDDRQELAHDSAVAYFNWLFDMDRYGTKGWNPFIAGLPISAVAVGDTTAAFTADNVRWSIAEGVSDETPGCAIVIVSANVDCSCLLSSYDGVSDMPMRTYDGECAVFVCKDGASHVVAPKYHKARYWYSRRAFSGGPKSYLTPKGRVWTKR